MNILNLIGRDSEIFESRYCNLYENELKCNSKESSFLVIGGAGSIGQAVTKEIFKRNPSVACCRYQVKITWWNLLGFTKFLYGYIDGVFKTCIRLDH
jgi:hypothetical protein